MPPKNAQKGGAAQSKKSDQKKKEKIIEDKTFGLKNKKGAKQQKFIQQVQHQVKNTGIKTDKETKGVKKDELKKNLAEINAIFRPVQQTAGKGGDPKSILCAFFKQGQCGKGSKCKFSHDPNVERKSEKRSAYVDMRDNGEETSADWDQATLQEVVEKKHGKEKMPSTEIVCKYFLDAVENGKYGWFWECSNGTSCIYRHALPPGFILKKDRKKMDKQKEEISMEDLVERERAALGVNTTRVTLETFLAWKKRKVKEKQDKEIKESEKKKKDYHAGRGLGLSGREMFTFNPSLAVGEDGLEEGEESLDVRNLGEEQENEEEMRFEYKEIDMTKLMSDYEEVDSSNVTIANVDRLQVLKDDLDKESAKTAAAAAAAAAAASEENNVDGARGSEEDGAAAVDIDEALFDGDDEDLDELDEELEDLSVT